MPGERGDRRREGEQHALLRGGGDGAGGYELVEEGLDAVAGGGLEGGVEMLVAGEFEGVGVIGEQMAQVEGIGGWFGDGDGAFRYISSGFFFFFFFFGMRESLQSFRLRVVSRCRSVCHFDFCHFDGCAGSRKQSEAQVKKLMLETGVVCEKIGSR